MKILIIGTLESSDDKIEQLAKDLSDELKKLGHETDICFLPFKRNMFMLAEQIFAYSLITSEDADALVTLGWPACFIPHCNGKKVCLIFDDYIEMYEQFEQFELREHHVEERRKIIEYIKTTEERTLNSAVVLSESAGLSKKMKTECALFSDTSNLAELIVRKFI